MEKGFQHRNYTAEMGMHVKHCWLAFPIRPDYPKQWSIFIIVKEEIIQIYITILKTVENVSKNTTAMTM